MPSGATISPLWRATPAGLLRLLNWLPIHLGRNFEAEACKNARREVPDAVRALLPVRLV